MQAAFVFDYSKIPATEYGSYVFKKVISALSGSRGVCRFNDGDVSRLNAKEVAAHARDHGGQLFQAATINEPTPLVDADTEFPPGVYLVGMWTDEASNMERLRVALDIPETEGFVGCIIITDPRVNLDEWNHLMRQLHLPANLELCDGRIVGPHNPYGIRC